MINKIKKIIISGILLIIIAISSYLYCKKICLSDANDKKCVLNNLDSLSQIGMFLAVLYAGYYAKKTYEAQKKELHNSEEVLNINKEELKMNQALNREQNKLVAEQLKEISMNKIREDLAAELRLATERERVTGCIARLGFFALSKDTVGLLDQELNKVLDIVLEHKDDKAIIGLFVDYINNDNKGIGGLLQPYFQTEHLQFSNSTADSFFNSKIFSVLQLIYGNKQ